MTSASDQKWRHFNFFQSREEVVVQRGQIRRIRWVIKTMDAQELLAPRPTPKLEDHPLSDVHDCLFSIFAATLHIGGRSSIRNLWARHAVVTGTHLPGGLFYKVKETLRRSQVRPAGTYYKSLIPLEILLPIQHYRLVEFVEQLQC
jgi:hypothetical protein